MKIMNINGVTFHLTNETADTIQRELKAYEEERFFERQLREEEAVARATGDWSVYSDLYKDMYGIRPRWMYTAG